MDLGNGIRRLGDGTLVSPEGGIVLTKKGFSVSTQKEPGTSVVLERDNLFVNAFLNQQVINSDIAKNHGFNDGSTANFGEKVALMHSELSEALESYRHDDPPSEHIPEFSGVEEEFADVIIRIMTVAQGRGYRIAEAMLAKQKFNAARPYKHGGKKF